MERVIQQEEFEQEAKHYRLLYELSKVLHSSLQEGKVAQLIVESFFVIFKAKTKVWLQETLNRDLVLKASKPPVASEEIYLLKKMEAILAGKPIHYYSSRNQVYIALHYKNQFLGVLEIQLPKGTTLEKDTLNLLLEVADPISNALGHAKLYAKIERLALIDGLTGLFNRIYFQKTLGIEIARAKRHEYTISLLMIDLDHFKQINDTFGHQIGDELLKRIALLCKYSLRKSDIVSRYGGEEFVAVLIGCKNQQALLLADKIRLKIADTVYYLFEFPNKDDIHYALVEKQPNQRHEWVTPISKEEEVQLSPYLLNLDTSSQQTLETAHFTAHKIKLTLSIGISSFPDDIPLSFKAKELLIAGYEEKDLLVYMADKALYHAKKSGRNKAMGYQDIQKQLQGNTP